MWKKLKDMQSAVAGRALADLFADESRATRFSRLHDGLLFDFSKTNIDGDILDALLDLARDSGVIEKRAAMMRGDKINATEGRAVLHTSARMVIGDAPDGSLMVDGVDVLAEGRETHARMRKFVEGVRSGDWPGTGEKITDIVNIGIGGSDLGPVMSVLALAPYVDGPRCHFVSNVDGADLRDKLQGLTPKNTLVIVASKTFTTQETLMNARSALAWMSTGCDRPLDQFVAISTSAENTESFGINPENVFGFESWIGGRYSIWSPIGLSLMLAIGPEDWESFLSGGLAMDRHFADTPLQDNLPVLLALVGLWHQKFCGYATRAVVPYEQRLGRLPAYLQQLEMESNGKSVAMDGSPLAHGGGPVVWGEPGTNGQHAFFQLIHQGSYVVPVEFLLGAKGHEPDMADHHIALVANCLAQSQALLQGRTLEAARKQLKGCNLSPQEADVIAHHRVFPGNRPSTTLVYPKLTPYVLGQILALYEHRVFVEGVILGLNSFDQWGVELGKELANGLIGAVADPDQPVTGNDSTRHLLAYVQECRS